MNKQYYVYILASFNTNALYVGFTENLVKRIWQHKYHVSNGFTDKYDVTNLVYYEIFEAPMEGIKREKQIKNLLRRKKIDLINSMNPKWKDLYEDIIG